MFKNKFEFYFIKPSVYLITNRKYMNRFKTYNISLENILYFNSKRYVLILSQEKSFKGTLIKLGKIFKDAFIWVTQIYCIT